jgi:hypothetical protein
MKPNALAEFYRPFIAAIELRGRDRPPFPRSTALCRPLGPPSRAHYVYTLGVAFSRDSRRLLDTGPDPKRRAWLHRRSPRPWSNMLFPKSTQNVSQQ